MPDDRIKRAIEWLRDAIRAEPKSYLAYLPLLGIDSSNLPTAVGNVTFLPGDSRTIATMKRPVSTIIKSLKNEEASKKALRKHLVEDINNTFRNGVVGELVVQAGDDDNAEEKAVRECRRTIDTINFFSDIFASSGMRSCVSLLGDGNQVVSLVSKKERTRLMVLMREKYDSHESSILYKGRQIAGFTCPGYARGPLLALRLPKADSRPALDSGFARLSELLANDDRTSLEDRILSAFQWAGRATVEVRREEAFLLYMIALESLVLGGKAASEITFQLRIKTGHLIKSRSEDRKTLLKRLGALYGIRSKIVHSGSFQVTDSELRETRQYTKQALLTVAIGKPFRSMKTEEEFDGWLEERLLS